MITPPLKRLDIVIVDFGPLVENSSVQCLVRPALVLQPTAMNNTSTTTIVCPLTKVRKKLFLPYHCEVSQKYGLKYDSIALIEQTTVIDQSSIIKRIGHIDDDSEVARSINRGLIRTLGIHECESSAPAPTKGGGV